MLEIDVIIGESFDEKKNKFVFPQSRRVRLEHSLVSVSKWESIWEESFLGKKEKTPDQIVSYVECMITGDKLPPEIFHKLCEDHVDKIKDYISAAMTATKLPVDKNGQSSRETITSELIYYWMISLNVPVEFEHWHLNRLITLIRVINLKNTPAKKLSMNERRELNRKRLAAHNSKG